MCEIFVIGTVEGSIVNPSELYLWWASIQAATEMHHKLVCVHIALVVGIHLVCHNAKVAAGFRPLVLLARWIRGSGKREYTDNKAFENENFPSNATP
jgi:hypothetical protein